MSTLNIRLAYKQGDCAIGSILQHELMLDDCVEFASCIQKHPKEPFLDVKIHARDGADARQALVRAFDRASKNLHSIMRTTLDGLDAASGGGRVP